MNRMIKVFAVVVVFVTLYPVPSVSQWALDTVVTTGTSTTGIAITSDGKTLVATNNTNPGSVVIISTADYSVHTIDVSSIENYPNGVAITPDNSTALVNTLHKTIFINIAGRSAGSSFTAPCAGTTLYGIAVEPSGQTALMPDLSSGCAQQGVRFIDATGGSSGSTFDLISTSGELYGIAITPDGSSALVSTFTSDSPKKINIATSGVQNIAGMTGSYGLAILHSGKEALIFDGDSLDRVSLLTNSVTTKISPLTYNTSFQNIAITSDDKYAFVVGAFEKLIISLANDSVVQTFTAGGANVATSPDGSHFYVTDSYNGTVRVYGKQSTNRVDEVQVPTAVFSLEQNYPNPFNPTTNIKYTIAQRSTVTLKIYDVLGREAETLVSAVQSPGTYAMTFNAARYASGVYFYRLQAGSFVETKRLLVIK